METIPARVIDVPAIVLAEHAENEIRKDFTVSERVEIGKAVEAEIKTQGERRGRPQQENENQRELVEEIIVQNFAQFESGQKTREVAAEKAGFGNAVEQELGKRQGQRTDLGNEGQESLLGELPVNLPEVSGQESREVAAEKAGFGSVQPVQPPSPNRTGQQFRRV